MTTTINHLAVSAAACAVLAISLTGCNEHSTEYHCGLHQPAGTTLVESDRTSLGDSCTFSDGTTIRVDLQTHEVVSG